METGGRCESCGQPAHDHGVSGCVNVLLAENERLRTVADAARTFVDAAHSDDFVHEGVREGFPDDPARNLPLGRYWADSEETPTLGDLVALERALRFAR